MKASDLIKRTVNSAFIAFGVYGLINGSNTVFYAIFTLLSAASLLLSLKNKDNNNDDDKKNKRDSWDDIRKRDNIDKK